MKKQTAKAKVPATPVVRAPRAADARTFALTGEVFTPGRGLATELHRALTAFGSATAPQLVDALLASGAYQKVAPQAAKLRPVAPVEALLKQWVSKGIVKA